MRRDVASSDDRLSKASRILSLGRLFAAMPCRIEFLDTAQRGGAATKTDRGCGRRPSRSASRLEISACCGRCSAHSRGP